VRALVAAAQHRLRVRCGAVRCGAVRCGAVRCGAVRCGARPASRFRTRLPPWRAPRLPLARFPSGWYTLDTCPAPTLSTCPASSLLPHRHAPTHSHARVPRRGGGREACYNCWGHSFHYFPYRKRPLPSRTPPKKVVLNFCFTVRAAIFCVFLLFDVTFDVFSCCVSGGGAP
jgi:hypothetical protein